MSLSVSRKDIEKAALLSPALERYVQISEKIAPDEKEALRQERHKEWSLCATATLLNLASTKDICSYWSQCADSLLEKAWGLSGFKATPSALFALGKLGAEELNLSSDVDLIIVSQEPTAPKNLSALKSFSKILSENTEYGFAFRVDYDLRPGGRMAPLLFSIEQAEDFFWSQAETWLRLAYVRTRYVCGDQEIQERYLSAVKKFIYRRRLDFRTLQDVQKIRLHLLDHYGVHPLHQHFDLKTGRGAIRDIELFAHALLVLHGGRNPEVIHHRTDEILKNLMASNLLKKEDGLFLIDSYWHYRDLENKAQAREDQQTHLYPRTQNLVERAGQVDRIVGLVTGDTPESLKIQTSEQLDAAFLQVLPHNEELRQRAHQSFKDFVKALRTPSLVFSLFEKNPGLLKDLALLFGHSPFLGQTLISRPELLDSFLYGQQQEPPQDTEALLDFLFEKKQLTEIFCSMSLAQTRSIEKVFKNLTLCADQIMQTLWSHIPHNNIELLALGKWGRQELGLRSDLDFIFVAFEGNTNDFIEKATKASRKLIHYISAPQKGGHLYSIDLRLRPSGKAGPLFVSFENLLDYLSQRAEIWERQTYLSSRWINSSLEGREKKRSQIIEASRQKKINAEDIDWIKKIRARLLVDSLDNIKYSYGGLLDIELCIQLYVIHYKNFILPPARPTESSLGLTCDWLEKISPELKNEYLFMRQTEQWLALVSGSSQSVWSINSQEALAASSLLNMSPEEIAKKIEFSLESSRAILRRIILNELTVVE